MNWLVVQDAGDSTLFEFTLAEILKMESLFKEVREESLNQLFCQEIATSFSQSANRAGKSIILWEQVQDWFREKLCRTPTNSASLPVGLQESDTPLLAILNDVPASPISKDDRMSDISELTYEAKSARDNAWYDVGSFLTYRFLSSGELVR
uniref:Uncharacterized protein n=1 Tax=Kalanchoe fedtschenkoi TaxID=63787 RepID=A0A7N1A7N3_KALFE